MSLDMSDPVVVEIIKARVKLLFEKPFFGNLSSRLTLVDASSWCKTAATDGKHIYYNREFIAGLTQPQLLFLLGHEVLHCVYDHLGRRRGRDPKIWNMANDYIVNWTLVEEKLGKMPDGGLLDKDYTDEMSSEEVYELLKKNSVTIKMPLDEHLELAEDGDGEDGEDEGEGEGGDSGAGGGQPGKGKGKSVDVTVMGKNGPPKLTEEDIQKIRNELKAAVIQTAQQVGAGHVPAGVRRLIQELTQPRMDWRSLLDAHIRSTVKDDYTFQRPSRRSWGTGWILPAQNYLDTIDIMVFIDMSGSISDEQAKDMLSEVRGIMETFKEFRLRVATFDTQVYNLKEYTAANLDDINTYEPIGGGGTAFASMFHYMRKNAIEPERMVCFTDGYPSETDWGDSGDYCDTLWVVHGNKKIVAPWGITAYYD